MGRPLKSILKNAKLRLSPYVPPHLKVILSIEGQISAREAALLHDLAAKTDSGVILEIGSYRGRSTVALALGTRSGENLPVYAIDPHEPFTGALGKEFGPQDRIAFFKNILRGKVADIVRLVNLPSNEVAKSWNRPIGLLWLDGDHTYEAVRGDFDSWEPHVLKGGCVVFHDAEHPDDGPSRVIMEALESGRFEEAGKVDKTGVIRKR
jgi:predicted O-methyltransferase YrrM